MALFMVFEEKHIYYVEYLLGFNSRAASLNVAAAAKGGW